MHFHHLCVFVFLSCFACGAAVSPVVRAEAAATAPEAPLVITGLESVERGPIELLLREIGLQHAEAGRGRLEFEYADPKLRRRNVLEHRIAGGSMPLEEYLEVLGQFSRTNIFLYEGKTLRVGESVRVEGLRGYGVNAGTPAGLTFAQAEEAYSSGTGDAYIDFGKRGTFYNSLATELHRALIWDGLTPSEEVTRSARGLYGFFFEIESSAGTYQLALTAKGIQGLNVDYAAPVDSPLAVFLLQNLPPSLRQTFEELARLPFQ